MTKGRCVMCVERRASVCEMHACMNMYIYIHICLDAARDACTYTYVSRNHYHFCLLLCFALLERTACPRVYTPPTEHEEATVVVPPAMGSGAQYCLIFRTIITLTPTVPRPCDSISANICTSPNFSEGKTVAESEPSVYNLKGATRGEYGVGDDALPPEAQST